MTQLVHGNSELRLALNGLGSNICLVPTMGALHDGHAALIAAGQRELRRTRFGEEPRSIFCGIGICFDCVVTINVVANQRACLIEISNDMKVESSL